MRSGRSARTRVPRGAAAPRSLPSSAGSGHRLMRPQGGTGTFCDNRDLRSTKRPAEAERTLRAPSSAAGMSAQNKALLLPGRRCPAPRGTEAAEADTRLTARPPRRSEAAPTAESAARPPHARPRQSLTSRAAGLPDMRCLRAALPPLSLLPPPWPCCPRGGAGSPAPPRSSPARSAPAPPRAGARRKAPPGSSAAFTDPGTKVSGSAASGSGGPEERARERAFRRGAVARGPW